jgi:oligoendopeptidase F
MDYKAVIKRIEQFDIETGRESLEHSAGRKDELNIAAIFDRYADLFTPRMVRWAMARKEQADAAGDVRIKRCAELLFDFFIDGVTGNKLKKLIDEESTYESKAVVAVDGEEIPFRQLPVLVQNEEIRTKRKAMVKASNPVKAVLTRYEKRMLKTSYKLLRKFTGKDYVSYYAEHKEVDLDAFAAMLAGFLVRTDAVFTKLMQARLATIHVSLARAEAHDYSAVTRQKKYDPFFTKEMLLPSLRKTLLGMGLDIDSQPNVHLDLEDRPKKVPRAFCSPIRIPEEIHLVMKPHGGGQDIRTLLHEAGHTEHFAHTDGRLAYELKHMGSHAVSESYAFLFEFLTNSEAWLTSVAGLPADVAKRFVNDRFEQELFMLRRYASKLIYELKLHRQDLRKLDENYLPLADEQYKSMAECYADILHKATKVKYPKQNWLLDVDSGFYSADYLRAWMMEAHLRRVLEHRFGARWFASKEAGAFLIELWSSGSNGRTINELAKHIGVPLDTSALEKDYERFNHLRA